MKILINNCHLILMIFALSCASQNNIQEIKSIEYKATTRGSNLSISVIGEKLTYKSFNEAKTIDLSSQQLKDLNNVVSKIKLPEIGGLKAPSEKRFNDGAMIASFKIIKGNTTYQSSEFDHENPPKELKNLYDFLTNLIK